MPGRARGTGDNRRPRRSTARRCGGYAVGAGAAAGAFFALGTISLGTAPSAHADFEDLIIQPIIDAISQATSVLDTTISAYDPSADIANIAASVSTELSNASTLTDPSVPLTLQSATEPSVDLSVNGGSSVPVLVDTGSEGLVIPVQDIGFQTLSFPVGAGLGSYSGGLDYFYLTFDMPVNFGDGITTADTPVDVALFEFPTTFQSFLGGTDVGILGVGSDTAGPGPSIPTEALPGTEGNGLLIDLTKEELGFGADPYTTGGTTFDGSPIGAGYVSIDGGPLVPTQIDFDSGGVNGTIPESSLAGSSVASDSSLPTGTEIEVFNAAKDPIYSYTTNATDTPTIVSSGDMDTGVEPFETNAVYLTYGPNGTLTFFPNE